MSCRIGGGNVGGGGGGIRPSKKPLPSAGLGGGFGRGGKGFLVMMIRSSNPKPTSVFPDQRRHSRQITGDGITIFGISPLACAHHEYHRIPVRIVRSDALPVFNQLRWEMMAQPCVIAAKQIHKVVTAGQFAARKGLRLSRRIIKNVSAICSHADRSDRTSAHNIVHGLPPSLVTMRNV